MSATNPADEYEALLYVADRLSRRFPHIAEDVLFDLVAEEWTRYDGARFRQYVPVLVEGNCLRLLREARPQPSESAPTAAA